MRALDYFRKGCTHNIGGVCTDRWGGVHLTPPYIYVLLLNVHYSYPVAQYSTRVCRKIESGADNVLKVESLIDLVRWQILRRSIAWRYRISARSSADVRLSSVDVRLRVSVVHTGTNRALNSITR
jgi:hypothetical protein